MWPGLIGLADELHIAQIAELLLVYRDIEAADADDRGQVADLEEDLLHSGTLYDHASKADDIERPQTIEIDLLDVLVDDRKAVPLGNERCQKRQSARLALAGTIQLLRIDADPMHDQDYLERGVRKARAVFDVDWILIQDVDEFWLHASGDLRNLVLNATQPASKVSRFNACRSEQLLKWSDDRDLAIGELDLFVQPLRLSSEIMAQAPDIPWVSAQPVEKVIGRAEVIRRVALVGHRITAPDGTPIEATAANDALIVHIPSSTFTRFQRKVVTSNVSWTGIPGSSREASAGIGAVGWRYPQRVSSNENSSANSSQSGFGAVARPAAARIAVESAAVPFAAVTMISREKPNAADWRSSRSRTSAP